MERLTGISRITLHAWEKSGFMGPSLMKGGRGTGNRRKYSFSDVVALRLVKRLRDEGVSLRALRKVAGYLRRMRKDKPPFASIIAVSGGDVVLLESGDMMSLLKKPGQYSLILKLDAATEAGSLIGELQQSHSNDRKGERHGT